MSEDELRQVALEADLIVNGYAFTHVDDRFRVLNLNNPSRAVVLSESGEVLETDMDDIEIDIVLDYLARNISLVVD